MVMENDPQYEIESARFLNELIIELERKALEMSSDDLITAKLRLVESAKNFRQLFSHNPSQLYSHLRHCLMFEKQMLCYPEECAMSQNSEFTQIFQAIEELMSRVRANDSDNRNLKKKYELFCCELHEVSKNNAQFDMLDSQNPDRREQIATMKAEQQTRLQASLNQLTGMRLNLVDKFKAAIELTETVQQKVVDKYLNQWRMNQGLAGNGAPPSNANNLDIIQGWCEHLAQILWETREQVKMVSKYRKQLNVDEQNLPDFLPELFAKSTNLLEHLITRSFIIEKQPPQVMKTNTR
jgi:signal transducer and activator of transcription 5B